MRLLPILAIVGAVAALPLVWIVSAHFFAPNKGGESKPLFSDAPAGSAVDSAARIEIEILRQQMEDMQTRLGTVEDELSRLQNAPRQPFDLGNESGDEPLERLGENQIVDSYAQVVLIAGRRKINVGLSTAGPSLLVQMFGMPREQLTDDCEAMTNPTLKAMLVTEDVGPIRVSMLRPAVESLKRVFEKVKKVDVDLYNRIATSGSLCVRRIRGSQSSVSNHAFGLAVDLNIDGKLDTLGDGKTQLGLTILSDFFQEEGWFWGAAFSREDSMHFEVAKETLEKWRSAAQI
ncbi:M15 family metallopeptidase [Pseudorhodobacter sp.]|uniref:M15 family metallopeptidase n=1 Tax=Pseudorhodobacter sp. TaxID=1934400 RepID=UPI002647E446|nr:M15 family metallopeptidase [Pseudorhodobacter sp.]MDN5788027.1 M15 family metallopeptidase [Pseudorhodobacter sp.]